MDNNPKPCPICGHTHSYKYFDGGKLQIRFGKIGCPLEMTEYSSVDEWNTRPLEDALQAKLDDMKNKLERVAASIKETGHDATCATAYLLLKIVFPELGGEDE